MNFKRTYLVPAMCAAVALSAFSGTASAADCNEIQAYIQANTKKVEAELFKHYGNHDRQVNLSRNNGNYHFLTMSGLSIDKVSASSCVIDVGLSVTKVRLGPPPGQLVESTRGGSLKMGVEFDASKGTQLCVKSNRVYSANFRKEGRVKEKIFVNNNKSKPYFNGCLF